MNYTINEIPDTATEANNTDYAIMWQDKTKKISISNLFKKLVKKSEVTNTISPINENPVTSKAVSSLLTISASTTTITDAPPLQNGIALRIFFTSEITGTDNTTVLQISYNGTTYNVKVPKDGALSNFVAVEVSSGVFKYLQAYTTLELLFDGTQFVIIGNPVVLSGSNYLYYADGSHNTNTVASGNMHSVTSNAVANVMQSAITLVDFGNNKIDASQSNFIWRSATLCSINIYDNTRTGVSIDFDFGASQIKVYTVVNGVTMGQKNVNLL